MASAVNSSAGAKYPKSGQAGAFSGVRGDRRLLDGKNTAVRAVPRTLLSGGGCHGRGALLLTIPDA
jgi:hypothetical protein